MYAAGVRAKKELFWRKRLRDAVLLEFGCEAKIKAN